MCENTDSSKSWIKEPTGFDAKFCFIHRIGILDFQDTHSLTTTNTHQPTIHKIKEMKRSLMRWQIFSTNWDGTFPPDSRFQTAPTRPYQHSFFAAGRAPQGSTSSTRRSGAEDCAFAAKRFAIVADNERWCCDPAYRLSCEKTGCYGCWKEVVC